MPRSHFHRHGRGPSELYRELSLELGDQEAHRRIEEIALLVDALIERRSIKAWPVYRILIEARKARWHARLNTKVNRDRVRQAAQRATRRLNDLRREYLDLVCWKSDRVRRMAGGPATPLPVLQAIRTCLKAIANADDPSTIPLRLSVQAGPRHRPRATSTVEAAHERLQRAGVPKADRLDLLKQAGVSGAYTKRT